jgi:hypothetical protein
VPRDSDRNAVRIQTGMAFAFDRIPHTPSSRGTLAHSKRFFNSMEKKNAPLPSLGKRLGLKA